MSTFLPKIIGDKRDWKAMEARAEALPRDYRIVYGEMKFYLWKFTSGDGMDIVALLEDVLELFEANAAGGRRVLEVTGEDVAAFCDDRLRGVSSYVDKWRTTLNRDVARKLAADPC
jgi:DNA-binding ferritin-like protein (Dps family)